MKIYWRATAFIVALASSPALQAKALTVMISGGFKAAWETLAPRFAAREGVHLHTVAGPSMGDTPQAIPQRLARGEKADVVIMVGSALEKLAAQGQTLPGSRVELADSLVGAVIKQGATPVSIKTEDELRAALRNARSIAYSDSASGRYVSEQLFRRLGIAEEVKEKAHRVDRIPVASVVAKGEYALGFQQVSELLPVPGVTFIGELPEKVQYTTRFAGAVTATSANRHEAADLLRYLSSPEVQNVVQSTGLRSVKAKHAVKASDTVQ
ncbi:substrate-binding domain-containing protein [Franconibacter pulveris 1160]|uniref:Molybdenum ABC transporter substrate-binding protein n=2 Tax=Franconibacter TaxID=1649295 RepID=A0A0J8YBK7_9ENTR|nr:molybdenum ABC transporter substrate-binding protein [Franconibacter pulveris]GGD15770.1 molybdenum ABC transporter substrate-binding protein [Franconibacter daqui]